MAEVMADQAAGLRRLISRDFVRVMAVTSAQPSTGVSFVARHLAEAIRSQGREVCLLDTDGEPLLGAWRAAQGDAQTLADDLERQRNGAEIALLDVHTASADRQARFAACALDVILLMEPRDSAVRGTYALIKRILSVSGKCRLHILLNRSADAEYANRIFANLSNTSDKFLSQSLQFLGELPADERSPRQFSKDMNFLESHPQSPLARMLRALAERILLWPYPGENDMSGFARRLVAALPAPPA